MRKRGKEEKSGWVDEWMLMRKGNHPIHPLSHQLIHPILLDLLKFKSKINYRG